GTSERRVEEHKEVVPRLCQAIVLFRVDPFRRHAAMLGADAKVGRIESELEAQRREDFGRRIPLGGFADAILVLSHRCVPQRMAPLAHGRAAPKFQAMTFLMALHTAATRGRIAASRTAAASESRSLTEVAS